ncbi:MAG: acyl-CoA synthetase [Rhodobacteraceae bacterium]|nr:acyl-CoA synthetase [Paracoccaceae bacterium]
MTPARTANFDRLLAPRHIAFIGGADAVVAITEARRRGFAGQYWPVNPRRPDLAGIPCYATIEDLPEPPDAVFLAIPAAAVTDTVARLAQMGAGGVVCYSAGFKEASREGARAEDALREAAGDMALIGPNCYGLINYVDRAALWPFAHGGDCPGYGAAIITQSGMLSSDITMSQRSLPLSYMISAGNQAVLGIEDFVDLLCEKPAVRAIGLHIEGLRDPVRFEQAALKALKAGRPIVALKTGRSAIGSALTISHTGSLSGTNELYQALFDRLGIISVNSPTQLLETLKFLCVAGAPTGNRIAGFTCSGGGATMLADHGETIGIDFPAFAPATARALRGLLPDIATVSNPLDYTTPIWGQPDRTLPVFTAAITRPDIDAAILVQDYPAPGLDESRIYYRNDAMAFVDATTDRAIPAAICSTLPENLDAKTRALLVTRGVAPMQGLHEALNAIAAAAWWSAARTRILASTLHPLAPARARNLCPLDEAQGKAWLSAAGFPVPPGLVVSGTGIAVAAQALGGPVALKMMGPKLLHKTEAGAVALNLSTPDAIARAAARMRQDVEAYSPGAATDRFLVEAMSPAPLAELIVSIRHDPQFGPALTLGSGGILVELIADAATLLLPASPRDIRAALEKVRAARLLQGFRGRAPADLDALARSLHGLATRVLDMDGKVAEIEINPLFVYPDHVVAVDVLMHVATP